MFMCTSYIHTPICIADMHTKGVSKCTVTTERSILVKITNSTVMRTLRGFCWYLYFEAQVYLVARQANDKKW